MDIQNKFLSKITTDYLKGISMIIIVIGHIVCMLFPFNVWVMKVLGGLSATGVAFFLFMSGYGNFLSIKKKFTWEKLLFLILRIYITFAICCTIYWFSVNYFDINSFQPKVLYSYIHDFGLISIDHKGLWYIKAQILAYLSLFCAYKFIPKKYFQFFIWLFWIIEIPLAVLFGKRAVWFVSSLAFPLGVSIAFFKDNFINILSKINIKKVLPVINVLCLLMLIITVSANSVTRVILLNILGVAVCLTIALNSYIFELKNNFIELTGRYSLEIYIIHSVIIFLLLGQKYIQNPYNIADTLSVINLSMQCIYWTVSIFILSYILSFGIKYITNKIMGLVKKWFNKMSDLS